MRLALVDTWRGLAVVGMIVFHLFLLLAFFEILPNNMYAGWWLLLARLVQCSFLGLVGASMVLSWHSTVQRGGKRQDYNRKQLERAGIILAWALGISAVTWVYAPDFLIWFGILHLIAVSSFLLFPLAGRLRLSLGVLLLLLLLGWWLPQISTTSQVLQTLGLSLNRPFSSFDFFPLFPWIAVVAAGMVITELATRSDWLARIDSPFQKNWSRPLQWAGRHALLMYIIHVPIIVIGMIITSLLPWQFVLGV